MLAQSGPTASASPFILQNSQDTRLFWNILKRGPNSLPIHSPLQDLGDDLSLPGPLWLGLLPLWPGLTPSSLLCSARPGRGPRTQEKARHGYPPRASLPPGGSRVRQAKGMPRKSPGPELQGAGAQPLCCAPVCFLKAHPPPLSRSVPAW